MTRRRSPWSSKRDSSGPSTIHQRDEAARAIADRVVRWQREDGHAKTAKDRQSALEGLRFDLPVLADRYTERSRTHESLTVDRLAVADGPALLDRLHKAPYGSPQKKRVEAAAEKWLISSFQRVRIGKDGRPVVLRMGGQHGDVLYGSHEGHCEYVGVEDGLRMARAETFEPFVGPEVPPGGYGDEACYCEARHLLADCPDAKPCGGAWDERPTIPRGDRVPCGRITRRGYICRYCERPTWEAGAWLVRAKSSLPDLTRQLREAEIETFEPPPLPNGAWGPRWCCRLKMVATEKPAARPTTDTTTGGT